MKAKPYERNPLLKSSPEDPGWLERVMEAFHEPLRKLHQGSQTTDGISDLDFSHFCQNLLGILCRKSISSEKLGEKLGQLAGLSDLALCLGLTDGNGPSTERAIHTHRSLLMEKHALGRREYSRLEYDFHEFSVYILKLAAHRAMDAALSLREIIEHRMKFPDAYLAGAVLSRTPRTSRSACEIFTAHYYKKVIQPYVAWKWQTVVDTEDKVQDLFLCLLYDHFPYEKTGNIKAGQSKRAPLLADYHGEAQLAGWLTLTCGNMIRDSLRTAVDAVSLDEERESEDDGSHLLAHEPSVPAVQDEALDESPCIHLLRGGALVGWKKLKPREQLNLILQTLHKVPPSVIARKIFMVHEGTVTKYTTAGLEKIYEGILEFARSAMGMGDGEAEDCFRFAPQAFPDSQDLAEGIVIRAVQGP